MSNIIEFKTKKNEPSTFLFELTMHEDAEGQLEVYMETGDDIDDKTVFESLVAMTSKFAIDQGLVDISETDLILDQAAEIKAQREEINASQED